MSRPIFHNSSKPKPLRTYIRKPQVVLPIVNKAEQTSEKMTTFSQILNENNSMFMDIDFERIEDLDSKKRRSEPSEETKKPLFTVPQLVKKRKTSLNNSSTDKGSSCSKKYNQEAQNDTIENLSQMFLHSIENENLVLTQTVIDVKENEDIISVITNPVTCSQYVQIKHEDESLNGPFRQTNFEKERSHQEELVKHVNNDLTYSDYSDHDFDEELIRQTIEAENIDVRKTQPNLTDVKFKKESQDKPVIEKNVAKPKCSRPKLLPVSSAAFRELGPFFGLTRSHQQYIMRIKNIQSLYDWQEECLGLRAIHDKTNLIYALPTSGGKTLVAEIAMFREILLRKKNVIFVLPYVSIVQEKIQDLMPFASEFHFTIEEYCAGKGSIPPMKRRKKNTIFICTIEKGQILFDSLHKSGRLKEIGMIVVDELHMVGDEHRGFALETLLMKTVFQKDARIQIIGMSATIANLREIATFLNADVYTRNFRPIELKEYVKIGTDILTIDGDKKLVSDAFIYDRTVRVDDYKSGMLKRDPDHIAALVLEVIPNSSCLIFCATKQNCESVAVLLADLLPKELKEDKREEKLNLVEGIKNDSNGQICSILAKVIPFGVAYHHSGLTNDERKHLEEAYRLNIINVICCTSTLAAGVNLPAKRVIIRSPFVGKQFLSLTRYKQMVGRAGRAGKCETGESIMICNTRDHEKLTNLLCSSMDETVSGFLKDKTGRMIRTTILNLLAMELTATIDDLVEFFKCSLFSVQIQRIKKTLRQVIVESIKELIKQTALTCTARTAGNRFASFRISDQGVEVFPDDLLEVSMLGKAATNAGITLEDAHKLKKDLVKAHENLVLTQCLHLLFIVAPEDAIGSINPDYKHFNSIFMRLERSMIHTANVVGITESLAMKLITRPGSIKESEKTLVNRFYVALMLFDLWNGKNVHEVATQYNVNRGIVFNLMSSAASRAYCIFRFCEIHDEFWVFKEILEKFSKRLTYCCSAELLPLMELPTVKIGRAKLLFAAGFKTVEEIAVLTADELVQSVKNVNLRQAEHIIRAAKHLMIEKIEECQDRLEDMKDVIKPSRKKLK